jgi:sugar phosphate isomerase/epimerase
MNPWLIGLSTGCFYRRHIMTILEDVKASGFHDIEICSFPMHLNYHAEDDVRRAGDRIRELGLNAYSFHAPFANHIDITSLDEGVRENAVRELEVACKAAAWMGADHIVLHPGPEREGRPPQEEFLAHMEHAGRSLNRVATVCGELGVKLMLENMLPHLLFGHISDLMYLLGEIKTPGVGICLDTGHANLAGELGRVIPTFSGHLKMLHVNDNKRNYDSHLPPGEGVIDWKWVTDELRYNHFEGGLILELAGDEHESTSTILDRAVRAKEYLRGVGA